MRQLEAKEKSLKEKIREIVRGKVWIRKDCPYCPFSARQAVQTCHHIIVIHHDQYEAQLTVEARLVRLFMTTMDKFLQREIWQ